MKRMNISSGTAWEAAVGYSRAVRTGDLVVVAGTTAVDESGRVIGRDNPGEQAQHIWAKIARALEAAGGSLADVIRTRTYLTDISRWQEMARVHHEHFADIRPAATLVAVGALVRPELLVEIEVAAVLSPAAES